MVSSPSSLFSPSQQNKERSTVFEVQPLILVWFLMKKKKIRLCYVYVSPTNLFCRDVRCISLFNWAVCNLISDLTKKVLADVEGIGRHGEKKPVDIWMGIVVHLDATFALSPKGILGQLKTHRYHLVSAEPEFQVLSMMPNWCL